MSRAPDLTGQSLFFRKHGGILRTSQALHAGIHPSTLYAMRDDGTLETVSRGVYRLADSEPLGNPDLVTVATRVQGGVVCLISALAFHEITTQIPHESPRGSPAWGGDTTTGLSANKTLLVFR